MKTVSIIVPVYNVADYLDKCISSIHSQLSDDVELILVDDGSTDGVSPELCDLWARRDSRITVIHKENGGLSDARNAGMKHAVGKYIFFVDSDDYIEEDTLEILKRYIELDDELIVFNYRMVDEDGQELSCSHFQSGLIDISDTESKIEFIAGRLTKYRIGWEAWDRIFRKDIIDKYNLKFYDNKTIFAEDLYFSLCYIAHISSLRVIPQTFYNYLRRNASIMGKEAQLNNLARFSLLSEQVYNHYASCSDCGILVSCYPLINAQILYIEIPRTMKVEQYGIKGLCNEFRNTLPNREFQHRMIKTFPKYTKYLEKYLSDRQLHDQVSTMKYLYDGNYFNLRVRNKLFSEKKKYLDKRAKEKRTKEY